MDRNNTGSANIRAYITVALRKESVDRNPVSGCKLTECLMVALRKESVDRNLVAPVLAIGRACRSPQGERG